MAVKFVGQKEKQAEKGGAKLAPSIANLQKSQMETLKTLVDEYGEVDEKVRTFEADPEYVAATTTRAAKAAEILLLADTLYGPEEKAKAMGTEFLMNLSAKRKSSNIPDVEAKAKVLQILGDEVFMEICSLPITKLKSLIPQPQLEGILVTEISGGRSIKVTRIAKKEAAESHL